MKRSLLVLLMLAVLSGCAPAPGIHTDEPVDTHTAQAPTAENTESTADDTLLDTSALFSDRDLRQDYDTADSTELRLDGNSIQCSSTAVTVSGSSATITDEGVYVLSGTLSDGMIIVNADKQDKVQLVLSNAHITSQTCAPIYILQADKVFLTLAEGSENTLHNGGSFQAIDENNVDGVVFSKEDLTVNGSGALSVQSPAGHGIVSKDALTITGGQIQIESASHGVVGKDTVCITGGSFQITAGKDGIHAENGDDTALGFVYIRDGSFAIRAQGDGISAGSFLQLDGGSYDILTGGGSENGAQHISDSWGGFGGGMGGPGAMGGGRPGDMGGRSGGESSAGSVVAETSEDSTSMKGIKSGGAMVLNGGSYKLDCADDAIHSNASVTVTDGIFTIATGDDGFHADGALLISGGTIEITESYEGLEGASISLSGGNIKIVSSDDGLNAAGGTDQSGFGGIRGDQFRSNSNSFICISGGTLFINASGDGIDSNGYLEITGGHTTVTGPTNGDTAVLDYDSTGTISGGTFIGTGANMMAQTLESTTDQGVFAVTVNGSGISADTQVVLTDSLDNTVIAYTPNLPFGFIVLSSPDIQKGETYTITVDGISGSFAAS